MSLPKTRFGEDGAVVNKQAEALPWLLRRPSQQVQDQVVNRRFSR
jgi:hypothetical protein